MSRTVTPSPLKALLETRCGCSRVTDIEKECGVKSATQRIHVHLAPSNFGDNRQETRTFERMGKKDGQLWYKETTTQRIKVLKS